MAAAQIDYFKENAGSFIYTFISDNDVKLFNNKTIEEKRLLQQQKIMQAAQFSLFNGYADFQNAIRQGIIDEYGEQPETLLVKLAAGINVYGKNGAQLGNARVGDTQQIDTNTGFPSGLNDNKINNGYDLSTNGQYARVWNNETKKPIGVFDQKSGSQISVFNTNTGKYESGITTDTHDKSNFWTKAQAAMPVIQSIIEWIIKLLGGKNIPSYQLSSAQYDGWQPPNAGGAGQKAGFDLTSILLLGGGVFLATKLMKDSDGDKSASQ